MSNSKRISKVESPLSGSPLQSKDYRTLLNISPARIAAIDFSPPLSIKQSENELLEGIWSASSACTEASLALAKTKQLHDPRQLIGKSLHEVFPRCPLHDTILRAWIRSGFELACHEIVYPEKDDGLFVEFSVYSDIEQESLKRIWIVGTDVSEQRIAWKRLLETEQHYRSLVERPGIVLQRVSAEGAMQYLSPEIVSLTGHAAQEFYDDDTLFNSLLHPDDLKRRQKVVHCIRTDGSEPLDIEYRLLHINGDYHWCYERMTARQGADNSFDFFESIILDVQEQKNLERERSHSQRMETMGALASGIAHDFNNYLSIIIGQLDHCLENESQSTPTKAGIQLALQAAGRCSDMARQLLSFSKKHSLCKKQIVTESFLQESVQLITHVIPHTIEVSLVLDGTICPVEGNSTQLQQVLMNLAVNSRDAMPDGGTLTISARTGMTRLPGKHEATRCLMLTVKDSGPGIPAQYQSRIFDPFFTTKKESEGTGLGLSTAYSIIQAHGGTIQLDTKEPGCCFTIMIPSAATLSREGEQEEVKPAGNRTRRGCETILIADDDPMVLSMLESALITHGYAVITARTGTEAIDRYQAHADTLQFAIIDHSMPGCSGLHVCRSIIQSSPDFPILITSGHSESMFDKQEHGSAVRYMSKPYALKDLLTTVRTMLDTRNEKRLANA